MKNKVLVYCDKGVFATSANGWVRAFKDRGFDAVLCNKKQLMQNIHRSDIAAVVMPGGNSGNPALGDETIRVSLGEDGHKALRKYVEYGHGTLLAVCGSAYRFSKKIEFHHEKHGTKETLRELGAGFYNAVTKNWRFYDDSPATADVIPVTLDNGEMLSIFYHGGPAFAFNKTEKAEPFLCFDDGQIAGAEIRKWKGCIIVLSVHPEFIDITPSYPVEKGGSIPGRATEVRSLVNTMKRKYKDHHRLLDFIVKKVMAHASKKPTRITVEKAAQLG